MDDLKRCSKCGIEKLIEEFYFRKDSQKYRNECIQCINIKEKEYESEIEKKLKKIKNNIFNTTRRKLTNLEKLILKTEEKQMLIFVEFVIQHGEFIML